MEKEVIVLNEARKVTLTAYLQDVEGEFGNIPKRPGILVLPGGGYQMCSDREADPVAFPYLKAGYQVFVLRYSVKKDALWPQPLEDYDAAMDLIRSRAQEWKLYPDKIAVIGFSAGGHLAGAAATMAKNRPAAAILGYAVLNGDVKGCNKSAPSVVDAVDDDTCPCFLFASRTDNLVPIANTIEFMQALDRHDISFESHVYAYGPHGFSTCDSSVQDKDTNMCGRIPDWVADSIGWLKDVLGDFGKGSMTKGFYNLTSGMLSQSRRLDVVANNMTNITTPGYKTETYTDITFDEVLLSRVGNKDKSGNTVIGQGSYILAPSQLYVNYQQGSLEETGLNLDFAIQGDGFFAIQTQNGTEYTRGGSFALDDEGYLVLPQQGRVLGVDGQPIQLSTDLIQADNYGGIYTKEGAYLGRIGVFTFADNNQLVKNDSGLFGANGQAATAANPEVRWGAVENSNVDMIEEMTRMMTAQRALQSAAQAIKLYDGVLTKATNDLGRL